MRKVRLVGAVACCFPLAACATSVVDFASKWVEPTEFEVVDQTFSRAEVGDWDGIRGSFHEVVADPGSDEAWSGIAETLAGADIAARNLIAVNVNLGNDQRRAMLTYEGPADNHWYVVTVRLLDGQLYGFHVASNDQSLVSANAFRIGDTGLPHLLLLTLGLGSIGVASLASYRVMTSTIARRKLWAVLSFVMVGSFTLNWATGAIGVQLLKLQVPPITFLKAGPAAPWVFGFGLPIFALIALRKVSRAKARGTTEPPTEESSQGDF